MDNNNNNDVNFLIGNAEFRLQYQCERIDGMYLGCENRLDTYRFAGRKVLLYILRETRNYECWCYNVL